MASKRCPIDLRFEEQRGRDFRTCCLDLARMVFLLGAVLRERAKKPLDLRDELMAPAVNEVARTV